MMSVTRDAVLAALRGVPMPGTGGSIVDADVVRALTIEADRVRFLLEVDPAQGPRLEPVRAAAEAAVAALPGVADGLRAPHRARPGRRKAPPPDLKHRPPPDAAGGAGAGRRASGASSPSASGKGGVGKSTVAANLAVALAQEGKRAGLLDADIYGPSQPRMMGVSERPKSPDGKTILPLHAHGVTLMSIGLMLKEGEAVIWRGPMLMGALQQMMGQVAWGELDALIVDLPPGTGDVQLTLSQKYAITGAIIVSTPQDVALLDARKALDMFAEDQGAGARHHREHVDLHLPELRPRGAHLRPRRRPRRGRAARASPSSARSRSTSPSGSPATAAPRSTAARPDSAEARAFRAIARRLIAGGIV